MADRIDTSAHLRRIESQGNMRHIILLAMMLVLVVLFVASWWLQTRTPRILELSLDNVRVLSEKELCPGEMLILSYDLKVSGAGKLVDDATVWREEPVPKTIIYSEEQQFLVEGSFTHTVILAWPIPTTYINPATARVEPLPPGEYRRVFSVSSVNLPAVFALKSIEFVVLDGCPIRTD